MIPRADEGARRFAPLLAYLVCVGALLGAQSPLVAGRPSLTVGPGYSLLNALVLPDGKGYLTSGRGNSVTLWDAETERPVRSYFGHEDTVIDMMAPAGGGSFLSGSLDGSIILWELASGKILRRIEGGAGPVIDIEINRDGDFALFKSAEKIGFFGEIEGKTRIQLWNLGTGSRVAVLPDKAPAPVGFLFALDGKTFWTVAEDGTIAVWDTTTGGFLRNFRTAETGISAFELLGDGSLLIFFADGRMKRLASDDGRVLADMPSEWGAYRRAWLVAPGDREIVSYEKAAFVLWEIPSAKPIAALRAFDHEVTSVAPFPGGERILVVSGDDGDLDLIDLAEARGLSHRREGYGFLRSLSFSGGGNYLTAASDRGSIQVWDMAEGRLFRSLPVYGRVWGAGFDAASGWAMAFNEDGRPLRFDPAGKAVAGARDERRESTQALAFSRDFSFALSGASRDVLLWDLAKDAPPVKIGGGGSYVRDIVIARDMKRACVAYADAKIQVIDLAKKSVVRSLDVKAEDLWSLAFSPDGESLLSADARGEIKLWNLKTGAMKLIGALDKAIHGLAWSEDGRIAAAVSGSGRLAVFDVKSGWNRRDFAGPGPGLYSVALSPDGSRVAAGSEAGWVGIWDGASGKPLVQLFSDGAGEWAALSDEGFFAGSPWGEFAYLSLIQGLRATDTATVADRLRRPDLIKRKLAGGNLRAEAAAAGLP